MKPQLKDTIRENTVGILENVDVLRGIGMTPARNVMLISPPGMAKTTVFRAVTHEIAGKITVIWCTGKSIQGSSDVTALFQAARSMSPCIVFIEDMDLFGRDRSAGLYGSDSHILNEFLTCLDGAQENAGVVVMASTNDIDSMDEALINRPGRFDVKIDIPLPDPDDRSKMLQSFLTTFHASMDKSVTRETMKNVIGLTEGLTGAYIKDLVKTAVIRAVSHGQVSPDGVTVTLSADDLTVAAQQVLRNYEIGKRAKKHHVTEPGSPLV
jgi:ATP-dependent 26S proteasome regulatory subunit